MGNPNPSICLKLLVDTKRQRVLFAEAGKDFVDFLFTLLSLPIGTVIGLLPKDGMVGSLGKLYGSVKSLSSTYMQPYFNKESLLKPKAIATIGVGADVLHMLMIDDSTAEKSFYYCDCRSRRQQSYCYNGSSGNPTVVTDNPEAICPHCSSSINTKATFVHGSAAESGTSGEGGYVKSVVTYMIMDDLEVQPMSTISSITMLNRFNVRDVGALEEKVVHLTMEECKYTISIEVPCAAQATAEGSAGGGEGKPYTSAAAALRLQVGLFPAELGVMAPAKVDSTKKSDPKAKALKTAKAVKSGPAFKKKAKKIRTSVTFHRPRTLKKERNPKYPRISATPRNKLDHYQILKYPLTTESAMKKIEDNNTLVFIVDIRADKKKIKDAVKKMYDIQTKKVNTLIRPDGTKKAYVRLTPDYDALDVANKIGII
ncbi:hypothetical protein C1H46_021339 [Malus baccata]|uniref:50S ribosomal protein L23, chloroplastic n=1 Tax=Malus baccata TaxID=106549 RepID=A0A540M2Q0_MALBA|nr:hypothetical protein C1H46_021339 [Malus baccata]